MGSFHLIVVTSWLPVQKLNELSKILKGGGGLIWATYSGIGSAYCLSVYQKDPTTLKMKKLEDSMGLPVSLL